MPSVSIWGYGNYASGNYGINAMAVSVGDLDLYFSYKTVIAFRHTSTGFIIRHNSWGPTTGKHMNWLDTDKSKRISSLAFELKLNELIESLGLTVKVR